MIKINEQNQILKLAVNIAVAKTLIEQFGLCDSDCDCGCSDFANKVNLCDSDCDCGCVDILKKTNLCDSDCDCGCCDNASAKINSQNSGNTKYNSVNEIGACSGDCDCGCRDNVGSSENSHSDENFNSGSLSEINVCSGDCDCGCADPTCQCEGSSNQPQNDGGISNAFGGNDDDGEDAHRCSCGCEHHGKHSHNHKHNHSHCHSDENAQQHCDCEKNNCQSEKNLADEYLNLARQIQADFDNYRRRNVEAVKQAKNEGIKQTVAQFLPSLDVVDRAMQYMHDEDSKQGLMLIRKMFEKAFADLKIEPIICVGAHYDPEFHDVVISEESNQPSGTIIEEIETGYTLDGKVIKHSVVKIAK